MAYQQFFMTFFEPSLVLLMNLRTAASLLGIILIIVGSWSWNRAWDVYDKTEPLSVGGDGDYHAMSSSSDSLSSPRFNTVAAIGWSLFALSYLLDRDYWLKIDEDLSMVTYLAIALIVALGVLQSHLIPRALLDGTMDNYQVLYVSIFLLGLLTNGFLIKYINPAAPSWMGPIGSLFVAIAPYFLFKARRKGELMETDEDSENDEEGAAIVPATIREKTVYVFNLGGPVMVAGWFLWWLSMNCMSGVPDEFYLQLFVTSRTYIVFAGAILVVIVYWMVGYALDATTPVNEKEAALGVVKNAPAFGVGNSFFGEANEIPVAMVFAWGVFGFSAFWPVIVGWVPFVVFPLFLAVGFSMAMQQTAGLREKDVNAVSRWARCVDVGIFLSILAIGYHGRALAVALMFLGLVFTSYGALALHADRKIGRSWLRQADVTIPAMTHDKPQIFSYGALAFPFGMIALAWGVSMLPY